MLLVKVGKNLKFQSLCKIQYKQLNYLHKTRTEKHKILREHDSQLKS